jgi:hypothetical protein
LEMCLWSEMGLRSCRDAIMKIGYRCRCRCNVDTGVIFLVIREALKVL